MKQISNNQKGFSIIEILIVIIVLGILASVIVSAVGNIQRNRRNSERQNDIKSLQQSVENFYAQNEKYPTLAQLNDAAWRTKNAKNLNTDSLTDPKAKTSVVSDTPKASIYAYQPIAEDNGACDNLTRDCMRYTLTATQEGADTFTKNNYN